jgi:hypothetical protein
MDLVVEVRCLAIMDIIISCQAFDHKVPVIEAAVPVKFTLYTFLHPEYGIDPGPGIFRVVGHELISLEISIANSS